MVGVSGLPPPVHGSIETSADEQGHTPIPGTTTTLAQQQLLQQDSSLPRKRIGLSTAELSQFCFSKDYLPAQSSSSSFNDDSNNTPENSTPRSCEELERASLDFYSKIDSIQFSRAGRDYQKWSTNPETGQKTRHVTGAIPILKGGRILVISSRRKQTWILPKGGWEMDETMEQSALRETFEEAGVWGTLGQPYPSFIYESGRTHNKNKNNKATSASLSNATDLPSDDSTTTTTTSTSTTTTSTTSAMTESSHPMRSKSVDSAESDFGTPTKVEKLGKTTQYSHVELILFPLYVKEVRKQWPEESFRKRELLTLDEAIVELKDRPEFVAALLELKKSTKQATKSDAMR